MTGAGRCMSTLVPLTPHQDGVIANGACGKKCDLVLATTVSGCPAIFERLNLTSADLDSDRGGLMHEYFGAFNPRQDGVDATVACGTQCDLALAV